VCLTPVIRKTEPHKKILDGQLSSGGKRLHLIGWNIGRLYKIFDAPKSVTADYLFDWHAPIILHKYKQTPIFLHKSKRLRMCS
jgi:hypothetical protein